MCNVANTRLLKNFCGRYNAVWSIFGRYLVNFVVVDIYYNPTGRSVYGIFWEFLTNVGREQIEVFTMLTLLVAPNSFGPCAVAISLGTG